MIGKKISTFGVGLLLVLLGGCVYGRNIQAVNFNCKLNIIVKDLSSFTPVNNAFIEIKDNFGEIVGKGETNSKGEISILSKKYNDSGCETIIWPFITFHSPEILKYFVILVEHNNIRKRVKVSLKDFGFNVEEYLYEKNIEIKVKTNE